MNELFPKFLFIILFFIFLQRLSGKLKFSLPATFALITLPWFYYISSTININFLLSLAILILGAIFSPKINLRGKTLGLGIMILSLALFLISVLIIPEDIRIEVELQRRSATRSGISVPAQVFANKWIESYRYREGLLFENLDFGNYFFIGHPRERGEVTEILKIYLAFLPLITFGIVKISSNLRWFLLSLTAIAVAVPILIADREVEAGFALVIPVVYFATEGGWFLLNGNLKKRILLLLIFLLFIFELVTFYGQQI